ncbi:MAG: hypothetical protein GY849_00365 [Deltaproteobacteria bacterium]|nr:hypothetical protein [Deltaproteobacteria bacterium]
MSEEKGLMDKVHLGEEIDQFQLLEEKIDSLINLVGALKEEKESFSEKLRLQEGKVADLTEQLRKSEAAKDMVKQRVSTILTKIEQSGV